MIDWLVGSALRPTVSLACAIAGRSKNGLASGLHERLPINPRAFMKGKHMTKAVSFALLAGGVLLIVFGVMASTSFSSDISRFFTGSPTDKAIWMLVGGVVASIVGAVGLLRG
jgi:hypothetical protein